MGTERKKKIHPKGLKKTKTEHSKTEGTRDGKPPRDSNKRQKKKPKKDQIGPKQLKKQTHGEKLKKKTV